jgi:multidrug resistance efflux pump
VEEGTLLAELDAPQIKQTALTRQYDLMLAEASLLKAQLRLAQAGSPETAISPDMSPEEVLARISPERAMLELDVEMARLRLERASALHVIASERLSSTQLIASFPGLIISLEKDAGDQVGAYEPFGTLADPTDLWVLATVLEENVSDIVVGQPVDIILDAFPEKTFTGSVLQVSSKPIVWQGENAYEVTITFDEGQEIPATINMGANVQVTGETREDVLIVPTRALITIGDQSYVEVVQDNGDVERVMVETGLSNAADTEIVAGLKTGQVIRIP